MAEKRHNLYIYISETLKQRVEEVMERTEPKYASITHFCRVGIEKLLKEEEARYG